jgi:hypothetical protein
MSLASAGAAGMVAPQDKAAAAPTAGATLDKTSLKEAAREAAPGAQREAPRTEPDEALHFAKAQAVAEPKAVASQPEKAPATAEAALSVDAPVLKAPEYKKPESVAAAGEMKNKIAAEDPLRRAEFANQVREGVKEASEAPLATAPAVSSSVAKDTAAAAEEKETILHGPGGVSALSSSPGGSAESVISTKAAQPAQPSAAFAGVALESGAGMSVEEVQAAAQFSAPARGGGGQSGGDAPLETAMADAPGRAKAGSPTGAGPGEGAPGEATAPRSGGGLATLSTTSIPSTMSTQHAPVQPTQNIAVTFGNRLPNETAPATAPISQLARGTGSSTGGAVTGGGDAPLVVAAPSAGGAARISASASGASGGGAAAEATAPRGGGGLATLSTMSIPSTTSTQHAPVQPTQNIAIAFGNSLPNETAPVAAPIGQLARGAASSTGGVASGDAPFVADAPVVARASSPPGVSGGGAAAEATAPRGGGGLATLSTTSIPFATSTQHAPVQPTKNIAVAFGNRLPNETAPVTAPISQLARGTGSSTGGVVTGGDAPLVAAAPSAGGAARISAPASGASGDGAAAEATAPRGGGGLATLSTKSIPSTTSTKPAQPAKHIVSNSALDSVELEKSTLVAFKSSRAGGRPQWGQDSGGVLHVTLGLARHSADWNSSPTALYNLSTTFRDRCKVVEVNSHVKVVSFTDRAALASCQVVLVTANFPIVFSEAEAAGMRAYVEGGGLLWLNDSTDTTDSNFDQAIRADIARIFPDKKLERFDNTHPLFKSAYDFSQGYHGYKIPPGDKYRLEYIEGLTYPGLGGAERLGVLYTRNDYADGLEIDPRTVAGRVSLTDLTAGEMLEGSLRFGINVICYALGAGAPPLPPPPESAAQFEKLYRYNGPPLPVLCGFKNPASAGVELFWVAEDWGNQAKLSLEAGAKGSEEDILKIAFAGGAKIKTAAGCGVDLDLGPAKAIVMDLYSSLPHGFNVALLLQTKPDWVGYESRPVFVRPGWNRNLRFPLDTDDFKSAKTGWKAYDTPFKPRQNVAHLDVLLYNFDESGEAQIGVLRLEK